MPGRFLVRLLLACGIVAAGIGCGGGASRTASTSSLAKAQFVKRVDAICARGRIRGLRYRPSHATGQSEGKAMAEAIEIGLLPALQGVIDQISAVAVPPGQSGRVETFLAAFQQAVDAGERLSVPSLRSLERLLARPGKLAREDSLESCVYG
jgi:hypothetical protein